MFHCEKHHAAHCVNRGQNMFILSIIKTTSRGRFHLNQTKHVSANVVSLLKLHYPSFPKGLITAIEPQNHASGGHDGRHL